MNSFDHILEIFLKFLEISVENSAVVVSSHAMKMAVCSRNDMFVSNK